MRYDTTKHKKVSLESDIMEIVEKAVLTIKDANIPEVEQQVTSWLDSDSYSDMVQELISTVEDHVKASVEDHTQDIVDSVIK